MSRNSLRKSIQTGTERRQQARPQHKGGLVSPKADLPPVLSAGLSAVALAEAEAFGGGGSSEGAKAGHRTIRSPDGGVSSPNIRSTTPRL